VPIAAARQEGAALTAARWCITWCITYTLFKWRQKSSHGGHDLSAMRPADAICTGAEVAPSPLPEWKDDGSLPLDGEGQLPFFLVDAHEESARPGDVFLFGKVQAIQRYLYEAKCPCIAGAYIGCNTSTNLQVQTTACCAC
jgi:hypothetical protein